MADKITQDFIKGVNQVLKSMEITIQSGKAITQADIDVERNHWNSQPVHAPTQSEIERFDVASKAAQVRELNKQLKEADENTAKLSGNLDMLTEKLSGLRKQ